MIPEPIQLGLFDSTASEPALLQPVAACAENVSKEIHNRSPTLNEEQEKLASSLHRKSRELVKNSRCYNLKNNQNEDLQQHEHTRPGTHQ